MLNYLYKNKSSKILIVFSLIAVCFLVISVRVGAVTAPDNGTGDFCKSIKNAKDKKACQDYVTALDECGENNKDCADKAYQNYIETLCGNDSKCKDPANGRVIARLSISDPSPSGGDYLSPNGTEIVPIEQNPIVNMINIGINFVASIIGIGAVLMIIYGGIQYITARDNAQSVTAAKQKIINAIIGLFAFGFLYAFINWLVPGGVF